VFSLAAPSILLEYEPRNAYWDLDPDPDRVILAANLRVKLLEPAQLWKVGLA
jgi:hypothetical protein